MKNIMLFLLDPFTKNLHHLLSVFVLIASYDLIYFFIEDHGFKEHFICLSAFIFLLSYLSVALYSILSNPIHKIYLFFIYLCCGVYFLMGTFSYLAMDINPRSPIVTAILGTNPQEASEFVSTFVNTKVLMAAIGVPLLLIILSILLKKLKKGFIIRKSIGLSLLAICFLLFLHRPAVWLDSIASVFYFVFFKYERCPELAKFATHPKVTIHDAQPKNIVLIIGESLTKSHCSLYGYDLPTNPQLEKLCDDSLLTVFFNVTSPGTLTADVFKSLLNTFHPENEGKANWYESTTLFDVTRPCGYKSVWLSNQTKNGMWDNLVGNITELSDTSVFVGNRYFIMDRPWCDGELIPITNKMVSSYNDHSLTLTIVHLMGNHEAFNLRYPPEYSIFQISDYRDYPENQREIRAHYDNSVLYNDYVVSEIINIFSDKEAIVFYFSDHSLDIYESDSDFFGHARPNAKSIEVSEQIPFMVYTSPLYRQHFPNKVESIKRSQNCAFRTDDLIYTIMDVAGISFDDNDDVKIRSLFSTP